MRNVVWGMMLVSLIENIEEIKKEIRTNSSNSFDIIKNNVPKYTMYRYVRECNKNNLNNFAFRFGRKKDILMVNLLN